MEKKLLFVAIGLAAGLWLLPGSPARAQGEVEAQAQAGSAQDEEPPIPPYVEQPAMPVSGGLNYCFVGPHPTDPRVTGGATWDASLGSHLHTYPPIDLRLFAYQDGCYHFTGDPSDFGYRGEVYSYYGAHPLLPTYGGGWCFMIGGHTHMWRPWSANFVMMGPWAYWEGPYDPFFWSYWPYYSFYYQSYYPRYYAAGRFYRGGYYGIAPGIRRVPIPPGGTWRTVPTGTTTTARAATASGSWVTANAARVVRPANPGAWSTPQGHYQGPTSFTRTGNAPSYQRIQPAPTFRSAPAPSGSFRSAPSFRGGGGGGSWHRR